MLGEVIVLVLALCEKRGVKIRQHPMNSVRRHLKTRAFILIYIARRYYSLLIRILVLLRIYHYMQLPISLRERKPTGKNSLQADTSQGRPCPDLFYSPLFGAAMGN